MTTLDCFNRVAAVTGDNDQLTVTADRAGVTARSGRLARWIRNLQASANRRTASLFIESLRNRFGDELTDRLAD